MAIPLPKYKSQVRVSGQSTAQTIDPSLAIKSASAGDALLGEIVEKAGGVASEYFQKKAKSKDAKTAITAEKAIAQTELNIEKKINEQLDAGKNYQDVYEGIVKAETATLKTTIDGLSFEYGTVKRDVDKKYENFNTKLNINSEKEKRRLNTIVKNAAISNEYNGATNQYNVLTSAFREAITNAKTEQEIQDITSLYESNVQSLQDGLSNDGNKDKFKAYTAQTSTLVSTVTGAKTASLELGKSIDDVELIAATALNTNDYEKPGQTVTIGFPPTPIATGPNQSQLIYSLGTQRLVDLDKISPAEKIELDAKFEQKKLSNNFYIELKQNIPEAEALLSDPNFNRNLIPSATQALFNQKNAIEEQFKKIQNNNANRFLTNADKLRPNVVVENLDDISVINPDDPTKRIPKTTTIMGIEQPVIDQKKLTIMTNIFRTLRDPIFMDEDTRDIYDNIMFEFSYAIEADEFVTEELMTLISDKKFNGEMYKGILSAILSNENLKDDFSNNERTIFKELLEAYPAYSEQYGATLAAQYHANALQKYYKHLEDGTSLDEYKQTNSYKTFISAKVNKDVNQRALRLVNDQNIVNDVNSVMKEVMKNK